MFSSRIISVLGLLLNVTGLGHLFCEWLIVFPFFKAVFGVIMPLFDSECQSWMDGCNIQEESTDQDLLQFNS